MPLQILLLAVLCSQPSPWETNMAAARQAYEQGRYAEAETLLKTTVKEVDSFASQDPRLGASLELLITVYRAEGKLEPLESLYRHLLTFHERGLGIEDPGLAPALNGLASLYLAMRKFEEAEAAYQRVLAIREKALGAEHPEVAASLENLGGLYAG
jgi:tetratricopeptide (TPR) repeat protein